jgi:ribonuclease P protein component
MQPYFIGYACGIDRLKKRADFLIVAKGKRWVTPNFTLQAKQRADLIDVNQSCVDKFARIGFTVTKKTGNSVRRNRIRRRLKSAVEKISSTLCERHLPKPDYDYVLIARELILQIDFISLTNELISAFEGVHKPRSSARAGHDTLT